MTQAKQTLLSFINTPSQIFFKGKILKQDEKVHLYQYGLDSKYYSDFQAGDHNFYVQMATFLKEIHLIQYWKTDKTDKTDNNKNAIILISSASSENTALTEKTDNNKNAAILTKDISSASSEHTPLVVDGKKAFFLLLSSGAIHGNSYRFNKKHCSMAVNSLNIELKHQILINEKSYFWLDSDDRTIIAKELIKHKKYHQDALTNKNFNQALTAEEICNVAYACLGKKLNKHTPEEVFIYYYKNYPELLRAKDFLKLKNFDKRQIEKHLKAFPDPILNLDTATLAIIASEINQKIIFDNPWALSKLIESAYWGKFVKHLILEINNTKTISEFESYGLEQFFLGNISADIFSDSFKQKIIQIIINNNNDENKTSYLPLCMQDYVKALINAEEQELYKNSQVNLKIRIEILKGNFSVLNYLSERIKSDLLNDPVYIFCSDRIQEKIDQPSQDQLDITDENKTEFIAKNLKQIQSLFEKEVEKYLDNNHDPKPEELTRIQHLNELIKNLGLDKYFLSIEKKLLKQYKKNLKRLFADEHLTETDKKSIKKISVLRQSLKFLSNNKTNKKVKDCVKSIINYLINSDAYILKTTLCQAEHIDDAIFGIKIGQHQEQEQEQEKNVFNSLEKLFEVCKLLNIKQTYFKFLRNSLSKLGNKNIEEQEFPDTEKFPKKHLKKLIGDILKNELAIFIDDKRKNDKRIFHNTNKHDFYSFEFLRTAYINLGAEEDYKLALNEIYNRIKKGEAPLEKYYEIRKIEKQFICPELEHAARQKELSDAAKQHLLKKNKELMPFVYNYCQPDIFDEGIKALTNSSSANETPILKLENGSPKPEKPSCSQAMAVSPSENALLNETSEKTNALAVLSKNYNPENPEHISFLRDIKSPEISPILSESFNNADEKDKASVDEAFLNISQNFTHLAIEDSSESFSDTTSIYRKTEILRLKKNQAQFTAKILFYSIIYNLWKENLDSYIKANICYLQNLPDANDPKAIDDLAQKLCRLNRLLEKLNLSNADIPKIIKFIFSHYDSLCIDELFIEAIDNLSQKKLEKSIQYLDIFLEAMLVFYPSVKIIRENTNYFPTMLAQLILSLSEETDEVNLEKIKKAVNEKEIHFLGFFQQHKNAFPEGGNSIEKFRKIFFDKNLRETFDNICSVKVYENQGSAGRKKLAKKFKAKEFAVLMECAENNPEIFNQFKTILLNNFFKLEFIPIFCRHIEQLTALSEKTTETDIKDIFFEEFFKEYQDINPIQFELALIVEASQTNNNKALFEILYASIDENSNLDSVQLFNTIIQVLDKTQTTNFIRMLTLYKPNSEKICMLKNHLEKIAAEQESSAKLDNSSAFNKIPQAPDPEIPEENSPSIVTLVPTVQEKTANTPPNEMNETSKAAAPSPEENNTDEKNNSPSTVLYSLPSNPNAQAGDSKDQEHQEAVPGQDQLIDELTQILKPERTKNTQKFNPENPKDIDSVTNLINQLSDININNKAGETVLHLACQANCIKIVTFLLAKKDLSINAKATSFQKTALHYACEKGNKEIVDLLIAHKDLEINFKNIFGKTPLHYACEKGHRKIAQCLIKNRATIDEKDNDGNTPLHLACLKEKKKTAAALIKRGANTKLVNNAKQSAFSICFSRNFYNDNELKKLLYQNREKENVRRLKYNVGCRFDSYENPQVFDSAKNCYPFFKRGYTFFKRESRTFLKPYKTDLRYYISKFEKPQTNNISEVKTMFQDMRSEWKDENVDSISKCFVLVYRQRDFVWKYK